MTMTTCAPTGRGDIAAAAERFEAFDENLLERCFEALPARGKRSAAESLTALGILAAYRARKIAQFSAMTCERISAAACRAEYAQELTAQPRPFSVERRAVAGWVLQERLELNVEEEWIASGGDEFANGLELADFERKLTIARCSAECVHAVAG